jgi:hypothetical protein
MLAIILRRALIQEINMEVRCPNTFCGSGNHFSEMPRGKLLIGSVTDSDFVIIIKCPRCKSTISATPRGVQLQERGPSESAAF